MELIIDFDAINDNSKRDWLIRTLKLMGIDYKTKGNTQIGNPQSLEEYDQDIKAGNAEIEAGQYKSASDIKKEPLQRIRKNMVLTNTNPTTMETGEHSNFIITG